MQEEMIARAKALLADHTVDRVLAWRRGELGYERLPAVLTSPEELEKELVYDDFCGSNLSCLLAEECRRGGRVLVFLKPCDSYSFNQLLTEYRLARESCFAIAIPCEGKCSVERLRASGVTGVLDASVIGDTVEVATLSGAVTISRERALEERCLVCHSPEAVAGDERLGDSVAPAADTHARFAEVERLEALSPEERYEFWQGELSRCIRCNACRNACPVCTCERCVFDNPESGVAHKTAADSFEENLFHLIRAFHVAGRCTDCGECSRVCPQHIPLHLLNRKMIKDIQAFYGDFQAGETVGHRSPLTDFSLDDREPGEFTQGKGGASHA